VDSKPLVWIGSSKKDLLAFPEEVVDTVGFSLGDAQNDRMPEDAKVLQGFGGRSVIEIVANDPAGTYRAVYTVRFEEAIYVLHCFQKKSTQGVKTSKQDIDLIRKRLTWAEGIHKKWKEVQSQRERKK
jgi:phage-related protein